MTVRYLIQHFALANPLYVNATVTFFTVSGGVKTTTKATLYSDDTTSATLKNPQILDSAGKFAQPIYIDTPVIMQIEGFGNVPQHDTGIVAGSILFGESNAAAAAASATAAATSATSASTSATAAATSASSASTSATNAATSATNSAASAAALYGTSLDLLTVGTGSFTFNTQANKQFFAGQFINAISQTTPTDYFHGQVTSYNSTTGVLVMDSQDVGGPGSLHSHWNLSVSGTRGTGGTATPGGSSTEIQYNNAGSLGGLPVTGVQNAGTGKRTVVLDTSPTLVNPIVGTQSPGDSSTKAASTKYADDAVAAGGAGIEGQFKNLYLRNGGSPNTQVSVSADALTLLKASTTKIVRSVSLTLSTASVGNNALDAGVVAANTWYSAWVVNDGTTTYGLLSLSATAPTGSGSLYKMRVGWVRTDGSGNLLLFNQYGRRCQYTIPRSMASGVAGTLGTNTNAIALGAFIPVTASVLYGIGVMNTGGSNNTVGMEIAVSSGGLGIFVNYPNSSTGSGCFSCIPESSNLYWSSGGSGNSVQAHGWEDNL